ncbi:MAG: (2Fe-2S) ferredoxin domain-containing protein [Bacteroidales bacterium]|nr:(2Fe-2S) ferredoxin domain-containing protein [Bacteroidales bacterium]
MKTPDEIRVCLGSSCFSRGNREIVEEVRSFIDRHHLSEQVIFRGSHCLGNCREGPNISINGEITGSIDKTNIRGILSGKLNIKI